MKAKFTLLLVLLIIPALPLTNSAMVIDQSDVSPPAPVFESLSNTGSPANSHIYSNNTEIVIKYRADRYDVDGLVLLGKGSNLTETLTNTDFIRNFTLESSFRANSFYSIELNVTSYTYFYAYAWSGTLDNGTYEDIDLINGTPGHELWIEEGKLYPILDEEETTADLIDGDFYTGLNTNFTVQYEVRNSEDNPLETVTLVTAENESALFDASTSDRYEMNRVNYTVNDFNFSIFEFELNLTDPIMYFTAFNDHGWSQTDAGEASVYRITNGFNFSTVFEDDLYTTLNPITLNITTFNETAGMDVGYQYRYFENDTSDQPLMNWITIDGLTNDTGELLNNTYDGTVYENSTLKRVYQESISQSFEVDNLVEIRSFVKYGSSSNITGDVTKFIIRDPSPTLTIETANNTFTRSDHKTVRFSFDTVKGEITEANVAHVLPDNTTKTNFNIINLSNVTFSLNVSSTNDTLVEGIHTFVFNVTNSLDVFTVKILRITVDGTAPIASISLSDPLDGVSNNGKVTISFDFDDLGIVPSGIAYATLDWDNNITINVTSLSEASHIYRKNGDYTIVLSVYDKAGNLHETTIDVTVSLPPVDNNTDNNDAPLPVVPIILALFLSSFVIHVRRKKTSLSYT